jgi:signal transduction histidine kinase
MRYKNDQEKETTRMLKSFINRKLNLNAREETVQELSRLIHHRGNVFFHGMVLSIFGILVFFVFYNISIGLFVASMYDLVAAAIMAGVLFLCYRGRFLAAKIICMSVLNVFVLIFSISYPPDTGLYLIYIPLIAVALAIFDNTQKKFRHLFIVISLANLITLMFFRPAGFPTVPIEPDMIRHAYLINLATALVVLFITLYYLMYVIDRTDRTILNISHALRQKNEELNEAYLKLDKFTHTVSHDLRAPLNSIKGLSTLGLYETKGMPAGDYFEKIAQCTDKLDEFIKTSLRYYQSNQESGREAVDILQLTQDVIQHFVPLESRSRIRFDVDFDLPEPRYILDRVLFRSIISNLISNAIKYHDNRKAEQYIHIQAQYRQQGIHLRIADNGRGIGTADLNRIFEAFYTAGQAAEKSTGVGLHLVKDALSKMKGTIQVQSELHQGTAFTLQIPAQPAQQGIQAQAFPAAGLAREQLA